MYFELLYCTFWLQIIQSHLQLAKEIIELSWLMNLKSPGGGGWLLHCWEPVLLWCSLLSYCVLASSSCLSVGASPVCVLKAFRSPAKGSLSLPVGPTED